MDDATTICLDCGLCCDGTVVGFVQLEREEVPRLRGLLEIEEVNGNGVFIQPCSKFCNACTIYDQRPKQCASFKCGLLKSVEKKETAVNNAMELTQLVKQQKAAMEKKLLALGIELRSPAFYFKMVELKNLIRKKKAQAPLSSSYQSLSKDIEQLDVLMTDTFGVSLD